MTAGAYIGILLALFRLTEYRHHIGIRKNIIGICKDITPMIETMESEMDNELQRFRGSRDMGVSQNRGRPGTTNIYRNMVVIVEVLRRHCIGNPNEP